MKRAARDTTTMGSSCLGWGYSKRGTAGSSELQI